MAMPLSPEAVAAFLVAVCFAAGLNVSGTVALLGVMARLGWVVLPGDLGVMASWWVIGASLVMFIVEVIADKVPLFDLVWNVLQTFVRVPTAALLAYAATPELSPGWQLLAATLGALLALIAHTLKTALRTSVSASPEPVSNIALSVVEDLTALGLTWFAVTYPWIAAGLVVVFVAAAVIILRWLWRLARSLASTTGRAIARS
jgi:hypothetical protein